MKKILTFIALLALCSSANAAIVNFTFNGLSDQTSSHSRTFTQNGVSITAYAFSFDRGSNQWFESDIHINNSSLGVLNTELNRRGNQNDNNQIDNKRWYDLLAFDLSPANAERIRFSNLQSNDDWIVGWDNESATLLDTDVSPVAFFNSLDGSATGSNNWHNFGSETGTNIFIGGQNLDESSNDDLRVTRLEIDTAPVPEPSTYAMFGAAFLMLGFVGYRSRNRKS